MGIKDFFQALRRTKSNDNHFVRIGFGVGSSAGVAVNEDVAMTLGSYYRGVIYVSTTVAKLPWNVKDRQNRIIENDRINTLLSLAPNSENNRFNFITFGIQSAIHHGNFFAEIERDTLGRPVALWPLMSESVEVLRTSDGQLVYRVSGNNTNAIVYLPASDVFHVRNFHTKDSIVGQGIVAYAKDTIGHGKASGNMAARLFDNGGIPSGVLEVPGALSDEAFLRITEGWKEARAGKKAASVAVLEDGVKYSPITIKPDNLQLLESRKFTVIEIAQFLGVHPSKLYDTERTGQQNQEQINLDIVSDTITSWCTAFEMEADIKLLNKRFNGRHSKFDLYDFNKGDMASRATYFTKMMQSAAMTPNEIRLKEGLSPYEGGDRYWIASNNFSPNDRIDEIIDAQIDPGDSEENETSEPSETDQELAQAVVEFLKK